MSTPEQFTLADIPGLGPVRRQALADAGIQDLQDLLRTKVAELSTIRGIGIWQARRIREHLRQRGLVLSEDEDGVIVAHARTPSDVATMAEAMNAIEETAAHEAAVEEEVELLVHALEEARSGTIARSENAPEARAEPAEPAEAAADSGEEDDTAEDATPDWGEEIRAQREHLPECALTLMDAIRQAAVTRQLTRQLTRFLITAGEFAADGTPLTAKQQRRASLTLGEVEQLIQRAVEKRAFRTADQKDLAERIRRRRKELEKLLETREA